MQKVNFFPFVFLSMLLLPVVSDAEELWDKDAVTIDYSVIDDDSGKKVLPPVKLPLPEVVAQKPAFPKPVVVSKPKPKPILEPIPTPTQTITKPAAQASIQAPIQVPTPKPSSKPASEPEPLPQAVPAPVKPVISTDIEAQNDTDEIKEVLDSSGEVFWLNFAKNTTEPNNIHIEMLTELYQNKIKDKPVKVRIISYAKSIEPDSPFARRLSLLRAVAVRKVLIEAGVPSDMLEVKSWGNKVSQDRIYIELLEK